MLDVEYTTKFKKDLKLAKKRNKDLDALCKIMKKIENEEPLESHLKDHLLIGNWHEHRELHVEPDWLLRIAPVITSYSCIKSEHHPGAFGSLKKLNVHEYTYVF